MKDVQFYFIRISIRQIKIEFQIVEMRETEKCRTSWRLNKPFN